MSRLVALINVYLLVSKVFRENWSNICSNLIQETEAEWTHNTSLHHQPNQKSKMGRLCVDAVGFIDLTVSHEMAPQPRREEYSLFFSNRRTQGFKFKPEEKIYIVPLLLYVCSHKECGTADSLSRCLFLLRQPLWLSSQPDIRHPWWIIVSSVF